MRIVVIGGSGHIGSFLVPRLVRAGHEVVSLSRGTSRPYVEAPEWEQVRHLAVDRAAEDAAGTFGTTVAAVEPDVVVDLVCFTPDSAAALVQALRGRVGHLLHCGSIWRYGPSATVPVVEGRGTPPEGEYGIAKDAIARMLAEETASGGLVTTSIHPGHIVGPGWPPITPLGNLDPGVWATLAAGEPLRAPGSGTELLHHVHADDIARLFVAAIDQRDAAAGEDFNSVAPSAVTVRGYAAAAAGWFGQDLHLEPVTWEQFRAETDAEHADATWQHLHRSHCASTEKGRRVLGFTPEHEPLDAILEAVRWLVSHDRLPVSRPLAV